MFRYTRGFRGADFGNLGDDDGGDEGGSGGYSVGSGLDTTGLTSPTVSTSAPTAAPATPTATGTAAKTAATTSTSPLTAAGNALTGGLTGGLSSAAGGLCGCANKDAAAQTAEQAQLQKQFPTKDCGSDPSAPGYAACLTYNQTQVAAQAAAYQTWLAAQNKTAGAALAPADIAKFQAVDALAKAFIQLHPDAANMTLAQAQAAYPADFAKVYAQIQQAYPELAGVDVATALAMSPGLASTTMSGLVSRLDGVIAGAGGAVPAANGSGGGLAPLLLVGGAIGFLVWLRNR